MNKIQQVSFRDMKEFFDYIPREEAVIVDAVWQIIFESLPHIQERLSYNVPFYYL